MSVHKLTTGDGYSYLTRHVAGGDVDRVRGQDAADYYTAEGNPPGVWIGRGAHLLGLARQQVSEEQMRALFRDGMHPDAQRIITEYLAVHLTDGMTDGQRERERAAAVREAMLGRAYPSYQPLPPFDARVTTRLDDLRERTGRKPTTAETKKIQAEEAKRPRAAVAGFDLVFAPVKSAALLWALHPAPRVRDAVQHAHRAAMTAALDLLEEHAAFTRTGAGGVAQIDTHGLVAVAFDHYDSRDGDPNLHTHVVIANKVLGVDGRWRALDARGLYRITVAASETYNTVFQAALTEVVGVGWVQRFPGRGKEPVWEIDGIPTELIEAFSQRATALVACYEQLVAAYREQHGHDPPAPAAHALRRQATLATRQGKKQPRSLVAMRTDWAHHAGPAAIRQVTRAVRPLPPAATAALASGDARPVESSLTRHDDPWVRSVVPDGPGPSRTALPGGPAVPDPTSPDPAPSPPHPDQRDRTLDRTRHPAETGVTPGQVRDLAAVVTARVAERRSTWTVWNLRAEAERLIRAHAADRHGHRMALSSVAAQRALVNTVVAAATGPGHSVRIDAPALVNEPAELRRRRDGESVFTEHGAARYTSREILDAEHRLLQAARTIPPPAGVPSSPSSAVVAAALKDFEHSTGTTLDDGQRALVTAFTTDPRLLVVGLGAAGTGKTTAMRAYHHTLTRSGAGLGATPRLVPLATSAASAAVLSRELGVPAENLHKFLHERHHGPHADALTRSGPLPVSHELFRLRPGDVVLVDEAGMAGTLNLDRLVALATAHGAKVRLLGDYRQLAAVESGGALRLIATDVGAAELTTVHRFTDPTEADATLKLRTGNPAGLDYYQGRGRIRGGSTSAMIEAAYRGWWNDVQAGKTSFMPAGTNILVTELSARARADRVTAGQVEPDGVRLHDGNTAGVGDWVVTRANQRTLSMHGGRDWVRNGDPWHVLTRGPDGSLHVEHLGHGGRIVLPAGYVARNVELLYATTAHRVQGGTVDTAHPLITDSMTREHLYVAATRARHVTTLYVATHDVLPIDEDERVDRTRWDPHTRAAREVLQNVLDREGAELSATEAIRAHQATAESLATLIPRYQHALTHLTARDKRTDDAADAAGEASAVTGPDLNVPLAKPTAGDISRYLTLLRHVLPEGIDPHSRRRINLADAHTLPAQLATPPPSSAPPGETPQQATDRYAATITRPYGYGSLAHQQALTREPAWPALVAALRRAEHAGHDVTDLLAHTVPRHVSAGASLSETLAVRTGTYLNEHPIPLPVGQPCDDPTPTWQLLTWTLKGHEAHGGHATELLDGAQHAASLHDVLHHAQHTARSLDADRARHHAADLPPWITPPRTGTDGPEVSPAARTYLDAATDQIRSRVRHLTDQAIEHRPAWTDALGDPPTDPDALRQWRAHVGVVAAYREQHHVTDDDPHNPLGPYLHPGEPGHDAYWHAAAAIVATRRLTDPAPEQASRPERRTAPGPSEPYDHIAHQFCVDIYLSLPLDERDAVVTAMVATTGNLWFGHPADPDTAAVQPAYHRQLHDSLVRRGHLTEDLVLRARVLPAHQITDPAHQITDTVHDRGVPTPRHDRHADHARPIGPAPLGAPQLPAPGAPQPRPPGPCLGL